MKFRLLLFSGFIAFLSFGILGFFQPVISAPAMVCPDSPIQNIDFENTKCALDDGQIRISIPFPGLKSKMYTPYELRPYTAPNGESLFCYYQEQKPCYYTEGLGEYLSLFYSYAVGVIGIIAVAMVVYGGYQYILARGNSGEIEKAKESIVGAVSGVVVGLLSFVILTTINPSIVRIVDPNIPEVPPIETKKICPSDSQVVPIDYLSSGLIKTTMTENDIGHRLMPDTLDKLYEAARLASKQGYSIRVNSAFRSWQRQQELYDAYKNGTGNQAAEPNCSSPHMSGQAVDLCMYETSAGYYTTDPAKTTCGYGSAKNNGCSPLMKKLQQIMQQAGFSRYCGEWWHFEYPKMSISCAPGEYGSYPTSDTCSK